MNKPHAILFGPLPPPYGGVAVFMSSLKDACIDRGAEVLSYAGDAEDPRVTRVNHRVLGHILRLLIRPKEARITDSTHFHLEYPHWLLLPAWLFLKRIKQFTWIKICHDGSLPSRFERMSAAAQQRVQRALASVDTLVVYSRDLEQWFREELSYTREIRFMPLLTPTPKLGSLEGRGEKSADHQVVTSIGAFIPSYGFHDVAAAVERLRQSGREVTLILLDGAFARDENSKREVLSGRRWIEVHEGVPHDEVQAFLAKSDVFVRAFAHESYGLSRIEAIMSGTPVIATNIGETRGMLTYEFGDVDALVKHLESVLYGTDDAEISHWQEVYRREAEQNLDAYLQLITGDANA